MAERKRVTRPAGLDRKRRAAAGSIGTGRAAPDGYMISIGYWDNTCRELGFDGVILEPAKMNLAPAPSLLSARSSYFINRFGR